MDSGANAPSGETTLDEHMVDIDENTRYEDDLPVISIQGHTRPSSLSSTESNMASVFRVLLRKSELLDEADQKVDGLDVTMVERNVDEMDQTDRTIRIVQIKLHHSAALRQRLTNRGEDIVLIQEPWSIANKVCRLGHNNYRLVHGKYVGSSRSCILIKLF